MTTVTADRNAINIRTTKVLMAILQARKDGKKGILLEGGTYSSKTYSALQFCVLAAQKAPRNIDINIVSESIPHLKGGCIRDWFKIMDETQDKNPHFNQTDHIYRRSGWNGMVTFLSADNMKALGMRREILFINEGDALSWETARELISRTEVFVIIDWNPRSEFWAHQYFMDDPSWAYDHSTYLDALDVIPVNKREEIESLGAKDPNYHNIYELGLMGKIEGLVHPHFEQVKELPDGSYFYGLDFGFGAYDPMGLVGGDPTVLTKHVIIGDNLYSQEKFYSRKPMTNDDIAREMTLCGVKSEPIYPDPNEPKSAEELRLKGFNVQATEKGPGSVLFGIKRVNSYYQHWTEDSTICIKDQRNYKWIKRKDKETGREYWSDDTTHTWSHGMDSRRYGVASYRSVMSSGGNNTRTYAG